MVKLCNIFKHGLGEFFEKSFVPSIWARCSNSAFSELEPQLLRRERRKGGSLQGCSAFELLASLLLNV